MARHHLRRTKCNVPARKPDNETSLSPHSASDAGQDEPREAFVVTDDFPTRVAISPRELDVIEAFLGGLLDDLLK
jgi:hypothetical protein